MEIDKYLENRWSPRAFSNKAVEDSLLVKLFEAAGRAASSNNEQPWRFILGKKGTGVYDSIYESLVDFNKAWSKTAPILVAGVVKNNFTKNDTVNTHAEYDLGAAVSQLTMKAFENDLYVHQMAGFENKLLEKNINLPDGYHAVVVFTIGYKGDKSQLHEKIATLEKGVSSRKKVEEILFMKEMN